MIQFKRGKTSSWKNKILEAGQPGYDKTENKLKIGDGSKAWGELDYLVGELDMNRLLKAESEANSKTIFTYGKQKPTTATKGKIYLQQFDGAVEADYVIETGRDLTYFFRKWNSGFIECWGKGDIPQRAKNLIKTTIFSNKTDGYFEIKGFWK